MNYAGQAHAPIDHPVTKVTEIYTLAGAPVNIFPMPSPQLQKLHAAFNLFNTKLGEDYTQQFWSQLRILCWRYREEHVFAPLSLDSPGSILREEVSEVEKFYERTEELFPNTGGYVDQIFSALWECLDDESSPLLNGLSQAIDEGENFTSNDIFVLVLKPSLVQLTHDSLTSQGFSIPVAQVISPAEIKGIHLELRLFVIGSPGVLQSRGFEWILSSPRSSSTRLFTFDFLRYKWAASAAFPSANQPPRVTVTIMPVPNFSSQDDTPSNLPLSENPPISRIDDDESGLFDPNVFEQNPDEQAVNFTAQPGDQENEDIDLLVETRLFCLEGGKMVFLDINSSVLALDLDSGANHGMLERIPIEEFERGMYYLYREGGSDFVPAVADTIMGRRAEALRTSLLDWKDRLRAIFRSRGIDSVVRGLEREGCRMANPSNIRNWMSYRSIGPRSPVDFLAILKLVGLGDKHNFYWTKIVEIRSAHRKAGAQVRRELLRTVGEADLSDLKRQGHAEFTTDITGADRLVARGVTDVSKRTYEKPESVTSSVFDQFQSNQ